MYSIIRKILEKLPLLRRLIRWLRWQFKKIPVLRDISIAIDRSYFADAGVERPDGEHTDFDWDYFETYAKPLSQLASGRVLELGCGHGYVSERLAQSSMVTGVVAIDKIDNFLKQNSKIEYRTLDLRSDEDLPNGFDTVVASEFIEHISEDDFRKLMKKITKALKGDGRFIGSTPLNPTPYKTFSGSRFHVREYSKRDLENILKEHFREVSVTPVSQYCMTWSAATPVLGD